MKMSMPGPALPVLGLTLFLAACDADMDPSGQPGVQAVLNEPFTLAAGQTAVLTEESLTVTFLRVLEDGRCPIDLLCISAGNATLSVHAKLAGRPPVILKPMLYDDPEGVVYEGFAFHVRQLMPGRLSDRTIPPGDYRAEFLVARP